MFKLLILICLVCYIIYFIITRNWPSFLLYGKLKLKKKFNINGNVYFVEEAIFNSSLESYKYYIKIVSDFSSRKDFIEERYDLYDWSYTYLRLIPFTIRIFRYGNNIQIIKSKNPLEIDLFEKDNSDLIKVLN